MRIFVYGSLKRGHFNHSILEEGKARFLTDDAIHGYTMYSLGPYPFIIPAISIPGQFYPSSHGIVYGEIYDCSPELVKKLDNLEGHPRFYQRTTVDHVFSKQESYAYVMRDQFASNYFTHKRAHEVPSGVWTSAEYKKLGTPQSL